MVLTYEEWSETDGCDVQETLEAHVVGCVLGDVVLSLEGAGVYSDVEDVHPELLYGCVVYCTTFPINGCYVYLHIVSVGVWLKIQ